MISQGKPGARLPLPCTAVCHSLCWIPLWVLLPPQAVRALIGEPKEQKCLGIKSTNKELPSPPIRQTRGTLRWLFIKCGVFFLLFLTLLWVCVCVEHLVLLCCSPVFSVQFTGFTFVERSTPLWRWLSPPAALPRGTCGSAAPCSSQWQWWRYFWGPDAFQLQGRVGSIYYSINPSEHLLQVPTCCKTSRDGN